MAEESVEGTRGRAGNEAAVFYSRTIEVRGHIIDSLILPRIMDDVMDLGGEFTIEAIDVGRTKYEPSYVRMVVRAQTEEILGQILDRVERVGATTIEERDVTLEPAPFDGVFPEGFYSTTNIDTFVRVQGGWLPVRHPEMDCGVVVSPEGDDARCLPVNEVRRGDLVAVGHEGIRVAPLERPRTPSPVFAFMASSISSEKPKAAMIAEVAEEMRVIRARGGRVLAVVGPAVVHTGAADLLCQLIEAGHLNLLFAGNALAVHDIESVLYGTSLGVSLAKGVLAERGHEHHLRTINAVRRVGGIAAAVRSGLLTRGIMYTCVRQGVPYVLCGSIRDDGPLPEVITDVLEAQARMRAEIHRGVDFALMLSTMLHSIATGNLLPASVTTVCVDINPAVVTKLMDRGSHQTVGLVMDVASFLRELLHHLGR